MTDEEILDVLHKPLYLPVDPVRRSRLTDKTRKKMLKALSGAPVTVRIRGSVKFAQRRKPVAKFGTRSLGQELADLVLSEAEDRVVLKIEKSRPPFHRPCWRTLRVFIVNRKLSYAEAARLRRISVPQVKVELGYLVENCLRELRRAVSSAPSAQLYPRLTKFLKPDER